MPPKKTNSGASKKTELKKKEKVIEDKTFGLKNKKGAKQQKFIQQVSKQVQSGGLHPKTDANKKKDEKEKKLQELKELASIFKPVQAQKVEKGTDPKSVVCAFFKQGLCTKGDRCKFSHDLTVENKVEKRSMYVDMRDDGEDDMRNWDDAKLKEVVDQKHAEEKKRPTTDIICKYFIEAVEKSKYGWFWECPNGEKCIYRHALPAGYVLKKDKKKMDENKPSELSLVDLIEKERAALGSNTTKVTLETFLAWKKRKVQEKKEKLAADEERKKNDYSKGKQFGISGREMFSFNPDLVDDGPMEDGDAAFEMYNRDEDEEGMEYKELDLAALTLEAQEADGSGTVASESRLEEQANNIAKIEQEEAAAAAAEADDSTAPASDAAPINKDLFMGLADELDDLDLEDEEDDDD